MTRTAPTPLALTDHSLAHPGRHDGWTPARQATFLRALASTRSVAQAARAAGMSRQSAYGLRARLKGEPFDLAWHAAMRCRFDALAEAAMERALNGVEVPHFHKGELIHTSRRFDERLTVALLAMRDRLGPPPPRPTHRAAAYGPEDFAALVERVESGPETFDEEARAAYEELYEEYQEDEKGDPEAEPSDETFAPDCKVSTSQKEYFSYGEQDFGD
jgi:hypothetical protein